LILCVGRLVDDKRFGKLPPTLAALESLDAERNWSAVVVGSGPQRQAIEHQAKHLGVADRITFESDVSAERLSELFTAATVLLHPSRREGFGIVVLEAATHGLPVIAVREPDNAAVDLIADGINGAVVESADPQLMAAAAALIANEPHSRARALQWWQANAHRFTADAAATAVEQVWQHTNIPPLHTPGVTVRNGLSKQLKNQSPKETHGISRDT
jgi:glycosyltransferase involved in cell wall biosynthesis